MAIYLLSNQASERATLEWVFKELNMPFTACDSFSHLALTLDGVQIQGPLLLILDQNQAVKNADFIDGLCDQVHKQIVFHLWLIVAQNQSADSLNDHVHDFLFCPLDKREVFLKLQTYQRNLSILNKLQCENTRLLSLNSRLANEHAVALQIARNQRKNKASLASFDWYLDSSPGTWGSFIDCQLSPNGYVYVVLGSAISDGMATFVGAIPFFSFFHALAAKDIPAGVMAQEMKKVFDRTVPENVSIAITILQQNPEADCIEVWSAGMPSTLVLDDKGNVVHELSSSYPAFSSNNWGPVSEQSIECEVSHDHRVFLYTAGVINAVNPAGEVFGRERLLSALGAEKSAGNTALENIAEDLNKFIDECPSQGDIGIVELRCVPVSSQDRVKRSVGVHKAAMPLSWQMRFELTPSDFKLLNPVPKILQIILGDNTLLPHKDTLFTVLSELYSNALEHGVLGLDSTLKQTEEGFIDYYARRTQQLASLRSGWISIQIQRSVHEFVLTLRDSGQGFNYQKIDKHSDNDSWGRGILLVKSLCESMQYSEHGSQVTARVKL